MEKILISIFGLLIVVLGRFVSLAESSLLFGKIFVPEHSQFIEAANLLQKGNKIDASDRYFPSFLNLIETDNPQIREQGVIEIKNLYNSGFAQMMDGTSRVIWTFEITTKKGHENIYVYDIQEKIDNTLLKNPIQKFSEVIFWLGVLLTATPIVLDMREHNSRRQKSRRKRAK